ncbi:MAG TPA: hypothetical protein VKI44_04100 [Acetobacteraceae bacterium]|nr:hypothetical protein [Acetobacteraceae bacterium]
MSWGLTAEGGTTARLVWRVKLIAELEPGIVSETEVARVERDDFAVPETLGLTLDEGKRGSVQRLGGLGGNR